MLLNKLNTELTAYWQLGKKKTTLPLIWSHVSGHLISVKANEQFSHR